MLQQMRMKSANLIAFSCHSEDIFSVTDHPLLKALGEDSNS